MNLSHKKANIKSWLASIFSIILVFMTLVVFITINVASSTQKNHYEETFDQVLWKAQQLQVQYYRFFNFITLLTQADLPLDGNLQTEYAYLVNRIDILRNGEINKIVRFFGEGNPIKLIFFIHGELNLLSIDIDELEKSTTLEKQALLENLQRIEIKINELVHLINRNAIRYASEQRRDLDENLNTITWLVWFLLFVLSFFIILSASSLYKNTDNLKRIAELSNKLTSITMNRMRFLSVLDHELRTPVNSILSIANILNKSIRNEQKEMLLTVKNSGETVLNNLKAFSDLSKLEANRLELDFSYGNLHQQFEDVCQKISNSSRYPHSNLYSFIDLNLPSHTYSDFTRLTQIFSALLENAFIHSTGHNISIVIRESPIRATSWRPDFTKNLDVIMVQVSVRAAGVALTEDQRTAIASSFYYLESDDAKKYMAGLNLSICYQLAKVIGGQLQFSTQHGMGDEFWMDIPIYFDKHINKIKAEVAIEKSVALLEHKTVLIIEEEQPAHIISMQVSSLGMVPALTTERLTGPLTIQVDIVIISDDSYLDDLSYLQLTELLNNQCCILSSNKCKKAQTEDLSQASFEFPLTQLTLRKTLMDYYQ